MQRPPFIVVHGGAANLEVYLGVMPCDRFDLVSNFFMIHLTQVLRLPILVGRSLIESAHWVDHQGFPVEDDNIVQANRRRSGSSRYDARRQREPKTAKRPF